MKIVIVEDEIFASNRLKKILYEINSRNEIVAILNSVTTSIKWFKNNSSYDIVFMDIQLSDGLSLEIFDTVKISKPIIFTTAYDEYALQAFKFNSIDYILKPVDKILVEKAMKKWENLQTSSFTLEIEKLQNYYNKQKYKERFLVNAGATYLPLPSSKIAYFYINNQLVNIMTFNKERYILDEPLDSLEDQLDPKHFFRINRQMLINFDAIIKIHAYFGNRLRLALKPPFAKDVIVSKRKTPEFKEWLGK
ncbi:MAG: LytTR family DNA-binding domain-containing protein [Candidatus Cloacimonadota bacterium]|nr:LytTR family DNA-binding domain-containing protein [Candidatus Cloacimonadota bacterium]